MSGLSCVVMGRLRMTRSHFFLVGAQRSGTTYLYHLLDAHPDIQMARPVRPEPKFFLDEACRSLGRDYYESTFFELDGDARVRGEKSTSYIESRAAAERIREFYPDARILFLLREPVARALSNYRFSVANGLETLPAWEAFEQEGRRRGEYDRSRVSVSPFAYTQRGRYVEYVSMYEEVFGADALHLMLHEDLVGGGDTLTSLYRFLDVSEDFAPPGVGNVMNATQGDPVPLTAAQYAELRGRFEASNAELADRYGLDLSAWDPV